MSDGGFSKFGSATENTMCNVETVIKKKTPAVSIYISQKWAYQHTIIVHDLRSSQLKIWRINLATKDLREEKKEYYSPRFLSFFW